MTDDPAARLRRLALTAPTLGDDGAWLARGIAHVLSDPDMRLDAALGLVPQAGRRRPVTRYRIAERDRAICTSATFFNGCPTQRAREIARAQKQLAVGDWRRGRQPPPDNPLRTALWQTLALNRGEPLAARTIRRILATRNNYSRPGTGAMVACTETSK